MRSPRPSALIEEAFPELEPNICCAIHQLSEHRGLEDEDIEDELKKLRRKVFGTELEVCHASMCIRHV